MYTTTCSKIKRKKVIEKFEYDHRGTPFHCRFLPTIHCRTMGISNRASCPLLSDIHCLLMKFLEKTGFADSLWHVSRFYSNHLYQLYSLCLLCRLLYFLVRQCLFSRSIFSLFFHNTFFKDSEIKEGSDKSR